MILNGIYKKKNERDSTLLWDKFAEHSIGKNG